MVKQLKSKKKRRQTFNQIRQAKTEQQYEYLVERHIVKPSNKYFSTLDHFSHLANNVYNQGLYRVRQKLFAGEWMSYEKLDKSMKGLFKGSR